MKTLDEMKKEWDASLAKRLVSRFHKSPCPVCGREVTNQAMGRKAHIRSCKRKVGTLVAA